MVTNHVIALHIKFIANCILQKFIKRLDKGQSRVLSRAELSGSGLCPKLTKILGFIQV